MYLRLLQIRDAGDLARYVALVARAERLRGRLEAQPSGERSGSNIAPELVTRASDAALRACPVEGCKKHLVLSALIVHINDAHRWSREQIATWLET